MNTCAVRSRFDRMLGTTHHERISWNRSATQGRRQSDHPDSNGSRVANRDVSCAPRILPCTLLPSKCCLAQSDLDCMDNVSLIGGVLPGLPGGLSKPYYFLSTLHAATGSIAQLLGLYIVVRAGTNLLPEALRFHNYKLWMRTTLALWWSVILLGVVTYYACL